MARRKRISRKRNSIIAVAIVVVAAAAWVGYQRLNHRFNEVIIDQIAPVNAAADRIDPANEGRHVKISGKLEIGKPPRDEQFGIGADAAILFRKVEMFQWQENCASADCAYTTVWSDMAIDSRKFHRPSGHENPSQRLADARFHASEIRLGAYAVDAELAAAQLKAIDFPVHAADLPPNLAASFSEAGGALYAGGDPTQPKVGIVRVSYHIVPVGSAILTGVQRGAKLVMN